MLRPPLQGGACALVIVFCCTEHNCCHLRHSSTSRLAATAMIWGSLRSLLAYAAFPAVLPGCDCTAWMLVCTADIHRMLFDGNEEEYEDFYDYSAANAQEPAGAADEAFPAASSSAAAAADGQQLALAMDGLSLGDGAAGGWELAIPSQGPGGGSKILGSRELARYYKQRPKPQDNRQSVIVNTIIAQYRSGRRPVGCPCQHLCRIRKLGGAETQVLILCWLQQGHGVSCLHILTRLSTQHIFLLNQGKP